MKKRKILYLLLAFAFFAFFGCKDETNWRNFNEIEFGKEISIEGSPISTLQDTIVSFGFNKTHVYKYISSQDDYDLIGTQIQNDVVHSFYPVRSEVSAEHFTFFGNIILEKDIEEDNETSGYSAVMFLDKANYHLINYKILSLGKIINVNQKDGFYYILYQKDNVYGIAKLDNNLNTVLKKEYELSVSLDFNNTNNIYFVNSYIIIEIRGDKIIVFDQNFDQVFEIENGMIFLKGNDENNTFSCLCKEKVKRYLSIYKRTYNLSGDVQEEKVLGKFKGISGNPVYYKTQDKLYFFDIASLNFLAPGRTLALAVFDLNDFSHIKYYKNYENLPDRCFVIENKLFFFDGFSINKLIL